MEISRVEWHIRSNEMLLSSNIRLSNSWRWILETTQEKIRKEDKTIHLLPSVMLCSDQVIQSGASLTPNVYILWRHHWGHLSVMSRLLLRQMVGCSLPPAEEVSRFGHRLWRSGGRDGSQSFWRLLASYSAVIAAWRAKASAHCSPDNHTLITALTTCSASLQGESCPSHF